MDFGSFTGYSSPFILGEGIRAVQFFSKDVLGNAEITQTGTLQVDATPPVSRFSVEGTSYTVGSSLYIKPNTKITIATNDVLVNTVACGIKELIVKYDGTEYIVGQSTSFMLSEGSHAIEFHATDNVGNVETLQSQTVRVDNTAPVSDWNTSGERYDTLGQIFVSTLTTVNLSAIDPVVNGVASGVNRTEYAVDAGNSGLYNSPFTLQEGTRTVSFNSTDNLENKESVKTVTLDADGTPPVTGASVQGAETVVGTITYINGDSRVSLSALDPLVSSVASGVRETQYKLDNTFYQFYFSTSIVLTEGVRTVAFFSRDNVQNTEVAQAKDYRVDATSPTLILSYAGANYPQAPVTYVSGETGYKFEVQDTTSNNVNSGGKLLEISVDTSPFTVTYGTVSTLMPCLTCSSAPFNEGVHTLRFRGSDFAGNITVDSVVVVNVDRSAPQTQVNIAGPQYTSNGTRYVSALTTFSFTASDPVIASVAAGVKETLYGIDGSPYQTYSNGFTLTEGIHTIRYFSRDRWGTLRSPAL